MATTMVNWLREYISSTPPEEFSKEWDEIERDHPEGVNAIEYLDFLKCKCSIKAELHLAQIEKINKKYDPKYEGVIFFYVKSHYGCQNKKSGFLV